MAYKSVWFTVPVYVWGSPVRSVHSVVCESACDPSLWAGKQIKGEIKKGRWVLKKLDVVMRRPRL